MFEGISLEEKRGKCRPLQASRGLALGDGSSALFGDIFLVINGTEIQKACIFTLSAAVQGGRETIIR